MVPISHVLWSHVWLGIASAAYERARRCARAARAGGDGLTRVATQLTALRATVTSGLEDLVAREADREALTTVGAAVRFNNLKLAASEQAAEVCLGALRVCGMQGYRSDSPYDVGRHVRDALSAPLMIANDRIRAANASMLLVAKELG
jgi:acyl-CoA dehydrogenase